MKKCPYCAETIKKEAIKCRFCYEMLPENETKKENSQTDLSDGQVIGGIIIIATLFFLYWTLIRVC